MRKRILSDRPLTGAEVQARYRARHPERAKAASKRACEKWRRENPGANATATAMSNRRCKEKNPALYLFRTAKHRAKEAGIEFGISVEDIVIPVTCPVFGVRLAILGKRPNSNAPSIDRIDNARGYIPGNIVVISWRANRIKADATLAELKVLADFYGSLA